MVKKCQAKILCVEDEPEVAELIGEVIRANGHHVEIAKTGATALKAYAKGGFDLATVDYQLPDMTGLELVRQFMALSPDTPIVIVTGRGSENVAVQALRMGVDNYIIKDNQSTFMDLLPIVIEQALAKRELIDKDRSSDALRESEALHRTMMENLQSAVYIHDDENILFANPAAAELLGHKNPEGLIGKPAYGHIHPSQRKEARRRTRLVRKKGSAVPSAERRFVRIDKSEVIANVTGAPTPYKGATAFLVIAHDITPQKQSELALQKAHDELEIKVSERTNDLFESEARFRTLIDSSNQGVLVHQNHNIVYANQALADIYGYASPEEILALSSTKEMQAPEFRKNAPPIYEMRMRGEDVPLDREMLGIRKDGTEFWLSRRAFMIDWDGKQSVCSVRVDISDGKQANDALRTSEARFRALIDNSPARITLKDVNGRYLIVNKAYAEFSERTEEKIIGKSREEVDWLPKDVLATLEQNHRDVLEHGKQVETNRVINPGSKNESFWEVTRFPVKNDAGEVVAIGSIATDNTDRKRAEEQFRISEATAAEERQTLQDAVESFTDGFILYDAEEKFVLCNQNFRNSIPDLDTILKPGLTFEEITRNRAKKRKFLTGEKHDEAWIQQRLEDFRSHRTLEREFKNGRFIELRHLETPNGGTAIIRTDITELKQAELTLRKNSDTITLMQKTAVAANEASIVEDAIQSCLNLICAYAGWPFGHAYLVAGDEGDELIPAGIWHLENPRKFENFRRITEETNFSSGVGLPGRVLSSGQPVWIVDITKESNFPRAKQAKDIGIKSAFAFPVMAGPDVVAVFEFFANEKVIPRKEILEVMRHVGTQVGRIIERKQAEKYIVEARKQADKANRAKSDFLASMSHELRTPLNAILGFSQLLDTNPAEPLTGSQAKSVNYIRRGGRHLLELIDEVLDLARVEAGKLSLFTENVVATPLIEECLTTIEGEAKERDISPPDRSLYNDDAVIRTDITRFKQVLLNLLSNAIKYNRAGGELVVATHTTPERMLRISVTDTGEGITKDKQSELFQPFNRLGQETTDTEGTGIGLVLTKRLVEEMNGNIGFESEVGKGSTFWIEFPLSQAVKDTGKVASDGTNPIILKKLSGKVLYVEDNIPNLDLMKIIISRVEGLNMISANNAELGLDLARAENPDIIIMDINLPGMNGFEALIKLKEMKNTHTTPVIALSANATRREILAGRESGFYDYLTKPIDIGNLLKTIEMALDLDA